MTAEEQILRVNLLNGIRLSQPGKAEDYYKSQVDEVMSKDDKDVKILHQTFYNCMQEFSALKLEEYKESQWISVKDRLPDDNSEVLIYSIALEKEIGRKMSPYACYYYSKFKAYGDSLSQEWLDKVDVSHWQPLPSPPKI